MRLVLFDIDGTLLSCGRQVGEMFLAALEEVYQRPCAIDGYSFAGKTDPQIVLDLLTAAGLERPAILERLPRMQQLYLGWLEERLDPERMRLLPGVREVLGRLASRRDLQLGLLTGNWRRGAMAKLGRFGLESHFPFGAFGDDGVDRPSLLPVALDRAERVSGRRFRAEETVIVGDSLLDVACGRAHGVPVLAVATGFTSGDALASGGASWVVENLLAAESLLSSHAA
ncbi:MAG: HAD hydrolase-like protein [Acidobacteria bacterium]|nr:HAD hydrolase-like protein [Acidobacteriota bacterium]